MKKAFVFDLDGTLLNSEVRISPKTYQALKKLKEEGHLIIIASGRMYASTMYVVENFLPFLKENVIVSSYNGGYIVDHKGNVVFEKGVSKGNAVKCIRFLRDLNIHRHIYINDKLISEIDDKEIRDYSKHSFVDYMLVDDLIAEIENSSHPTLKILAIGEPNKIDLIKKLAEKEFQGEFNLMKSWNTYLD
ncbi:MAG: HAD-IIB family hydrolase, partial [Thermotogota bacterium]|nr:HAD-IIB family hydrolase [Thermotogota bacterium]